MEILNRTTIGIAAGVCGTLFLGYCYYFDQQRRKDPDFKKKLRESKLLNLQYIEMKQFSFLFQNGICISYQ